MDFCFYLGTHVIAHMAQTCVPLFVSRRRLAECKRPRSICKWALDSGGFTELSMYGRWLTSPGQYAAQARWWYDNVPGMQWAAVQDWMCEPFIIAKTGLDVATHQRLTIQSYLRLRELQPTVPWVPVLQGYAPREYVNHLREYEEWGVDLRALPRVGVGSVCRRQSTDVTAAVAIIRELHGAGIRIHAFGFKVTGLMQCAHLLASSDSMAWSFQGRMSMDSRGQTGGVKRCAHRKNPAHCLDCALLWRERLLATINPVPQGVAAVPPPRPLRSTPVPYQ